MKLSIQHLYLPSAKNANKIVYLSTTKLSASQRKISKTFFTVGESNIIARGMRIFKIKAARVGPAIFDISISYKRVNKLAKSAPHRPLLIYNVLNIQNTVESNDGTN